jgi:hypothetical protein
MLKALLPDDTGEAPLGKAVTVRKVWMHVLNDVIDKDTNVKVSLLEKNSRDVTGIHRGRGERRRLDFGRRL